MSRIYISHSSIDKEAATALKDWLVQEHYSDPSDIFLDFDPDCGLVPGQRWESALDEAIMSCQAVLFLVSDRWLNSQYMIGEYQFARRLHKKLFVLLMGEIRHDQMRYGLSEEVIVRLDEPEGETQRMGNVAFSKSAIKRLKLGLERAGISSTGTFELQPGATGFRWREPYRGLAALESEDAAVMFGRKTDVDYGMAALHGLLQNKAADGLAIVGASGVGKSSYLRAGLWPRLARDETRWLPLKPVEFRGDGDGGSDGLLWAVEEIFTRLGLRQSRNDLRQRIETAQFFIELLRELRRAAAQRMLLSEPPFPLPILCIDPGDWLLRPVSGAARQHFLNLARTAIEADEALLLFTARSSSYACREDGCDIARNMQKLDLRPIATAEAVRVIAEPARVLRTKVPSSPLIEMDIVERLSDEIARNPNGFPLIAAALKKLWEEFSAAGLPLSLREFEQTGGTAAIIQVQANNAISDTDVEYRGHNLRGLVRQLFIPRLVRVDTDSNTPLGRIARQDELPAELIPLAEALIDRRLLVTTFSNQLQAPTIEVAHDGLLRHWRILSELIAEEKDKLLLLDGVLRAAIEWEKADSERKAEFLLHRGARLAAARALKSRGDGANWERVLAPASGYLEACSALQQNAGVADQWRRFVAAGNELRSLGEHELTIFKPDQPNDNNNVITALLRSLSLLNPDDPLWQEELAARQRKSN